jgi:fatty-acyl-CoA synthase
VLASGARFADASDVAAFEAVPWEQRLTAHDLFSLFERAADAWGSARALRFLPGGLADDEPIDLTFAELLARVYATANALRESGVREGETTAFLLSSGPEALCTFWAGQAAGMVAPVNHLLEPEQIAALLRAMRARVVVVDSASVPGGTWEKGQALKASLEDTRVLAFDELPHRTEEPKLAFARDTDPFREAVLFHTGGTTGVPKFVPLTQANLACTALFTAFAFGYRLSDRVICGYPLFHVGGLLACCAVPHCCGAEVVLLGRHGYRGKGVVAGAWASVQKHRISVLHGAPTVLAQLAETAPDPEQLPELRLAVSGAAALPAAVGKQLAQRLRKPVVEAWGLTEATLAVAASPRDGEIRHGSVGLRLPYCLVKAVRLDSDGRELADCAPGEIGVLAVRGPSVFAGYRGRSSPAFLRDGWLNTGDLGRIDADGSIWITGREKDVIKRGGHGIDPAVIEEALYQHPDVALAAAVGKPDAYAGELPVAYVQLKPGRHEDPEALLRFAASLIRERAAVPKAIWIVPNLPLTGVGKIYKPPLRLDAARRALEAALRGALAPETPFSVAVEPHGEHGTVARIALPRGAAVLARERLRGLALHIEYETYTSD